MPVFFDSATAHLMASIQNANIDFISQQFEKSANFYNRAWPQRPWLTILRDMEAVGICATQLVVLPVVRRLYERAGSYERKLPPLYLCPFAEACYACGVSWRPRTLRTCNL